MRYPDALITCSSGSPSATIAPESVVIFEVLCKSPARLDLGAKSAEYQSLPSLKVYVVLDQSAVRARVFRRNADGDWIYEVVGPEEALALPEVAASAPMAEIYEDVELAG